MRRFGFDSNLAGSSRAPRSASWPVRRSVVDGEPVVGHDGQRMAADPADASSVGAYVGGSPYRRPVVSTDVRASPVSQAGGHTNQRTGVVMPDLRRRHDVVVVGARAAGAATALLLARQGHDVVLVDRAEFPADTVSTHQIARPGVALLHRWGLLPAVLASGAPAIRRVTFTADGESVTRTVKPKAGVDLLVAPRRYVLDTIVAEAAARAGARIRYGVTVTGVRLSGNGRALGVHGHD